MNKSRIIAFCAVLLLVGAMAWAFPVPDTGQTKCYDDTGEVITCPSSGQPFYGQDGSYSINPLSCIKLDGSGNVLQDSAASWVMVKDTVSGLFWEMKTSKDGIQNYNDPHDADNTYTWYDSNVATNGGYAGTPGDGTDTEDFITALNDARFGGYDDWRVPTVKELAYIADYGILSPGPTIDPKYFPNTMEKGYWSSTSYFYASSARLINFESVGDGNDLKGNAHCVRAVRGVPAESSMVNIYRDNGDGYRNGPVHRADVAARHLRILELHDLGESAGLLRGIESGKLFGLENADHQGAAQHVELQPVLSGCRYNILS